MSKLEKFSKDYLEILNTDLKGLNLTRIVSLEDFQVKQVEDSLFPLEIIPEIFKNSKRVIDLGFGGGFPILPLALELEDKLFIGLEARKKKVDAVRLIANRLNIKNVTVYHTRYQDFHYESGDLIISKAMDKAHSVINQIKTKEDVSICFYKGPKFFTIEQPLLKTIDKKWENMFLKEYELSTGDKRVFVGYKNVPRGTKKNKRKD